MAWFTLTDAEIALLTGTRSNVEGSTGVVGEIDDDGRREVMA